MRTDPFAIKKFPKWHPVRLLFTAQARLSEQEARWNFEKYKLPEKDIGDPPELPPPDYTQTAVSRTHMQYLLHGLKATEHLSGTVVVEIGCYRGVTTQILGRSTTRKVIGIDPFIGYGGDQEDYIQFQQNIKDVPNASHIRQTSGEAFRNWNAGAIGFIFIDSLHDYVNTAFDLEAWSSLLIPNGIVALHDTDYIGFAGTRKAVFKAMQNFDLFSHCDGLTILRKR